MGLTDVGLNYISKGVDDFIKKAQEATNTVTSFNTSLTNAKGFTSYNKNLSNLSTTVASLDKPFESLNKNVSSLNQPFEQVNKNSVVIAQNLEHLRTKVEETQSSVNTAKQASGFFVDTLFVLKNAAFGTAGTFEVLKNSANGLANLADVNKNAGEMQKVFLMMPSPIQNVVIKFAQLTQNVLKSTTIFGKLLQILNRYVVFQNIFDFLDPVKLAKSAQNANTLSKSLRDTGNSLNRLENLLRGFALGLEIIEMRAKKGKATIDALGRTLVVLARSIDTVSDFFGDWSKTVKKGDKDLQDFDEEQKIVTENTEEQTNVFKDNREEIVKSFLAIGSAANTFNGLMKDGSSKTTLKDTLFDLLHVRQLLKIWGAMPPQLKAVTVAVGAFVGVAILTEKLGGRAAGLTAIQESFDKLSQNAGLATNYIQEFSKEADNQLTQAETLTLANRALAGSTGEFAKELADSLPTLLEFARVRSAATGEDVNFLFQSAIEGIKKQEPEILDNMGLVVRLDEVYATYAATLGKTAKELTATQKQQAILSRVNSEAARNIEILGEATLSNADKIVARGNIISDILDNISLSVQGLLGPLLDIQLDLAKKLQDLLEPIISMIESFTNIIGSALSQIYKIFEPTIQFFVLLGRSMLEIGASVFRFLENLSQLVPVALLLLKTFTPFGKVLLFFQIINPLIKGLNVILEPTIYLFQRLGDLLVGITSFFVYLGNVIVSSIGAIIKPVLMPFIKIFDDIKNRFENMNETIDQFVKLLAIGFGSAMASLVNVMARTTNEVLDLVADMAEGIASFLIGESPPPKGPLSKIDVGGKATFEAWLDGFSSVGTRPVELVAKEVNNTLGNIAQLSLEQTEQRLKKLDLAIRPFSEQLSIAQARFEAISAPAEAALRAIERQLDASIEALVQGDVSAAASVKALDAQRASLQKNLELQQQQVDFAQIELALAKSKQAEERALLEIQKARLSGQELTPAQKAIEQKLTEPKAKEEKGADASTGVDSSEKIEKSASETGNELGDLVMAGFVSNLDFDELSEVNVNLDRIGLAGADITSGLANLPNRIADSFGGMGTAIQDEFTEVKDRIDNFINDIISDFSPENFGTTFSDFAANFNFTESISGFLDSIELEIDGFIADIASSLNIDEAISSFIIDFDISGTIMDYLNPITDEIDGWIDSIATLFNVDTQGSIGQTFNSMFDSMQTKVSETFGEDSVIAILFNTFFGEDGTIRTAINTGIESFNLIKTAIDDFMAKINGEEGSLVFIMDLVFGPEGLINTALTNGKDLFQQFYDFVFGEEGIFVGLRRRLNDLITAAVYSVLNSIADGVNFFIGFFEDIVNGVLEIVGLIVDAIPENVRGPLADIPASVTFDRVQLTLPALEGAATGGLFSGGMLRVGEKGEEIVGSASKMAVFPNNFVTAIQSLESVMVDAIGFIASGNTNNNINNSRVNNNNMTVNINQPMNPTTVRQRLNNFMN